jgi:hypothetical protein
MTNQRYGGGGTMDARQVVKVTLMGLMILVSQGLFGWQTETAHSQEQPVPFEMSSNVNASVQLAYNPGTDNITYKKLTKTAPSLIVLGFEYGKNRSQVTQSEAITLSFDKGEISIAQAMAFVSFLANAAQTMNPNESSEGNKIDIYIAGYAVAGKKDDGKTVVYGEQVSNVAKTTLDKK